jgi:hypothetical protein
MGGAPVVSTYTPVRMRIDKTRVVRMWQLKNPVGVWARVLRIWQFVSLNTLSTRGILFFLSCKKTLVRWCKIRSHTTDTPTLNCAGYKLACRSSQTGRQPVYATDLIRFHGFALNLQRTPVREGRTWLPWFVLAATGQLEQVQSPSGWRNNNKLSLW